MQNQTVNSKSALKEHIHRLYDRFIRLRGTPEEIAWGAALGFFVAMSPTMGFQTFIVIPIAALLGISKVSAVMGVWLTNPVTAPFIYYLNYRIGAIMFSYPIDVELFSEPSLSSILNAGRHVVIALTAGGILTGIITSIAGYFLVLNIVKTAREKALCLLHKKECAEKLKKEKD